ncbi:hypothetical protein [Prochlorococcus sp. MIT 1201]|uniref:hypothetical protein n=1 Tax=Prochlorococcus sp. MIT 1201 TaxID=3082535 RepID=UPI0039A78183
MARGVHQQRRAQLSRSGSRTASPQSRGTTAAVKPGTSQGALGDVGTQQVSAYRVLFAETVPTASWMAL